MCRMRLSTWTAPHRCSGSPLRPWYAPSWADGVARTWSVYRQIASPRPGITTQSIPQRIIGNRIKYGQRNKVKKTIKAVVAEAQDRAAPQ